MSSPNATATATLIFDASSIRAGVASANRSLGSLYDVVKNNWWGIRNLGDAFAGVSGLLGGALLGAGKAAADFQTEMAAVARTTYDNSKSSEENAKQAKALGDQLLRLSEIKPVDIGRLTNIAEQAGALGVASKDVATFTSTIADLTNVTNLSDQDASKLARIAGVFNLQSDQYKNLASAIYETGVNTAATETEIVNMTTRLAPFAAAAGLSAAQTVALSAATLSLGPKAEAGATSLQKLLGQFGKVSAAADPKQLENFAKVAGTTAARFKELINDDPGKALTSLIEGLGKTNINATLTNKVLTALGISNSREIATLNALALGTRNTANENVNLANAIKLSQDAFDKGTAVQDAAAKQYQTINAQIQIAKNSVHAIGVEFGQSATGPMTAAVGVLTDLIVGFEHLSPTMKEIVFSGAAVIGSLAGMASVALLVGPRIILASGAYKQLTSNIKTLVAAQALKAAADSEDAAVTSRGAFLAGFRSKSIQEESAATIRDTAVARLRQQLRQQELALLIAENDIRTITAEITAAATEGNLVEVKILQAKSAARAADIQMLGLQITATEGEILALDAEAVATRGSTVAMYGLGVATKAVFGPIGLVVGALALGATALGFFGAKQKSSVDTTQKQIDAYDALKNAINSYVHGQDDAIRVEIANQLVTTGATKLIQKYGISIQQLYAIITGTASQAAQNAFLNTITAAVKGGDADAQKLAGIISDLGGQYHDAAANAQAEIDAQKALGVSANATANSLSAENDALDKQKQALEQQYQALISLVDAKFQERDAVFATADAQAAYNTALAATKGNSAAVAKATRDLTSAQIDQSQAQQKVLDAQDALSNARADQQKNYEDDQRKLLQDQNSYLDSLDKVTEAQKNLNDLTGPKHVQDLTDATNKLVDAQLNLVSANKKVGDAQFRLNYLIQEGASTRDISDAQDALASAHAGAADAAGAVTDAQGNLNDVQNANSAENLAKAQRLVQEAELAAASAAEELSQQTQLVAKDQAGIAKDTAYKSALQGLQQAQIDLADATDRVHQAQADLSSAKNAKTAADNLARATLALEEALYRQAQAHVEVQKEAALMQGKEFTAQQEATALSKTLLAMANTASGPVATQIRSLGSLLSTTLHPRSVSVDANTAPAIAKLNTIKADLNTITTALGNLNGQKVQVIGSRSGEFYVVPYTPPTGTDGRPLVSEAAGGILAGVHMGASGNFGVANGPTSFTFGNGRNGQFGEVGQEAIIPLGKLYDMLRPIATVSGQLATQNAILGQFVTKTIADNRPADTHYDQRQYHLDVDVETNADVTDIDRELAWTLRRVG